MNRLSDNLLDMEHRVGGSEFRGKLAQQRADSGRSSRAKHMDKQFQQASAYLRMCRKVGREQADCKYPMLAAACGLAENGQSFRLLELLVLGSLPRAEVAARFGAEQQAVEFAEALFLDIDDLIQTAGWIKCHVFFPEVKFGSMELAAKMKTAQYGGPVVAHALLDGQKKLPLEEAQQKIIDQELPLHAKLEAALEFDLDTQSAEQFLKVFLEYDLQRKKLQFEREKFQLECALAREQRIVDEADEKSESPNDVECDQQSSLADNQFQLTGIGSVGDEQLVA
jgi:hypothetical protein